MRSEKEKIRDQKFYIFFGNFFFGHSFCGNVFNKKGIKSTTEKSQCKTLLKVKEIVLR